MKQILTFVIVMLCSMSMGCSHKKKEKEISQNILFIYQKINYSDSYWNRGYYVTNDGKKVSFDVSEESPDYHDINHLYEYLSGKAGETDGKDFLSEDELNQCYKNLYKIDLDAEITEEPVGIDCTDEYLYGVRLSKDGIPTFELIYGSGNSNLTNTDEHAGLIKKVFEQH